MRFPTRLKCCLSLTFFAISRVQPAPVSFPQIIIVFIGTPMLPKTPQSYRIQEPIRSEIVALMKDLDLEFVRKSFVPLPQSLTGCMYSYPRVKSLDIPSEPKRNLCADLANRNHHYKDFKSVYPSDYSFTNLSFDWD